MENIAHKKRAVLLHHLLHLLCIISVIFYFHSICHPFSSFILNLCFTLHPLSRLCLHPSSFPTFFQPWGEHATGCCTYCLPFGMLMWSADAWHSDQSEDSLKGGENWGVVGREMRKTERKRESIGPPGFQGREGKVNNRAVEGRDGGMWRERAGVWKLIIAGRAALDDFTLPHPLSLSLTTPHPLWCCSDQTLPQRKTNTNPSTYSYTDRKQRGLLLLLPSSFSYTDTHSATTSNSTTPTLPCS